MAKTKGGDGVSADRFGWGPNDLYDADDPDGDTDTDDSDLGDGDDE